MTQCFTRTDALVPRGPSAAQLVAGTELELPLVLVLLAPLELACRDGLATEDLLVPRVLIRGACDTPDLTVCHNFFALAGSHDIDCQERQQQKGMHLLSS